MTARVPLAAALGFVVAVLASVPAIAQPPGPPGAPPRDVRPAATGTAVIRGRITAGDTGRPLRRARIRLTAPELGPQGLTTSTNPDGKYEIKDLPAGRYTLQVSRSGYLQLSYGQRRPLEAGKPLQVTDRQIVENIDFALPRTSVITGRVLDELGEPVSDTPVWAMRSSYWQGRRQMVPAGGGFGQRTDDAGQYRLTGLVPGTYYVMALLQDTWTVTENGVDTVFGYAPTYFPGVAGTTNAKRVTVGLGQEAAGTDFSLVPGRSASVSGMALDSRGRPMAGRSASLSQEVAGPSGGSYMGGPSAVIGPDGTFTIKNVPPGEYRLGVQTTVEGKTPGVQVPEAVTMLITVEGVDITNLTLLASAGWSAAGRVVTEAGAPPTVPASGVRLAARSVDASTAPRGNPNQDSGRVKDDWTFAVTAIFGATRLRVTVPDGWMVKSIFHDGLDISDAAVEMKSGEEMSDLQVVITNYVTTVSGRVTDDKGAPMADATVIVFSDDSDKWAEDSRWVRSARPDQQGQYQITGLPPGTYLAVAVDYVENGMWNDPEYLNQIRRYGQPLTLLDAGSQALSLKLVTPQ